ncbi:NAD(P)/FAD-dependent oxidoreductase [Salinirubellus sp. GCM10025818]|uniref:NAD(P)/FAD-dependent oxidoreductase n=1 Tax=Salinirubellus TaxID=2162630 RepID=UPI0030CACA57
MHVCIVGGGIVGLASAYYLADRGASVTLLDKGSLGSGSTDRAVGGIRAQFSSPENVDLSLAAMEVWDEFEEEFGTTIEHRRPGYLFLARTEGVADALRGAAEMQRGKGVPTETLSPGELGERWPALHAERYLVGTYSPTDGFADPHLAVQGFAGAAREAGVDVRTKTAVTGLLREGERVVGVEAEGERIEADFVVNAAGPWAREVAAMAGIEIPVAPRRRQVAVVDPEDPVPEDVPLTADVVSGSYFRPEREGRALVGGHFDDSDPDADPDRFGESMETGWAVEATERAAETADYFGPETRIRRGWAGLYALTPDDNPIIEESVEGFVQAVGFSGHGFQHAPATGQVVADLCFGGSTAIVSLDPYRGDRFEDVTEGEGYVV